MTTPDIITYESKNAAPKERWLARYVLGQTTLPMIFTGPTEDGVADKAELWWRAESQKVKRKETVTPEPGKPVVDDPAKQRKIEALKKARAARWAKKDEAAT